MTEYIGEIVVGVVLLAFAAAFRGWSTTIREKSDTILNKLSDLAREFHQHRLSTERRVTKVETQIENLQNNHKRNDD